MIDCITVETLLRANRFSPIKVKNLEDCAQNICPSAMINSPRSTDMRKVKGPVWKRFGWPGRMPHDFCQNIARDWNGLPKLFITVPILLGGVSPPNKTISNELFRFASRLNRWNRRWSKVVLSIFSSISLRWVNGWKSPWSELSWSSPEDNSM